METPVTLPSQLRAALRAQRQRCKLTQEEIGRKIGVSQKRVARIEKAPEKASFEQIARICSALGCRLVLAPPSTVPAAPVGADSW